MQAREKVGKSRNTVFFQWFVAREGRRVGSLKRQVRSHVARWEMKNCTPLWREAHFQVKIINMYKAHQGRSTFGSCDVEKCARRCGAKHISKSNVQNTPGLGALLEVEMSKKCRPLWREATFPSQNVQTHRGRSTFGSWDVDEAHFQVKMHNGPPCSEHFWNLGCRKSARRCGANYISKPKVLKTDGLGALLDVQMWFLRGRHKGLCTLSKVSKTWGFSSMSKSVGRRGTFEEDLERCIFRGRCNKRDVFIRDVRRSGRWFSERGCILEHQIFSFGKMILCDRRSTLYDLASLFRGGRNTSETWAGKIANRIGTKSSALHSTFHYTSRRKSRRIALFCRLQIDR